MLVWVAVDAITITWKRRRLLAAPRIPSLRIVTHHANRINLQIRPHTWGVSVTRGNSGFSSTWQDGLIDASFCGFPLK